MPNDITISQALRKIRDLKGRLAKHRANAAASVMFPVRDPPAYAFSEEVETAESLARELLRHQTAVTVANAEATLEWDGKKVRLTWAVKRLEELKGEIKWYEGLVVSPQEDKIEDVVEFTEVSGRYENVKREKKFKCFLPEAKRAERVRALQEEFNRLNDQVETINHRTSVVLEG